MRRWVVLAAAMALFALAPRPAQSQAAFGPMLAWGDDTDIGIGGRIDFGLGGALGIDQGAFQNLFGSAGATYYFTDCIPGFDLDQVDCSVWEIFGNVAVPFTIEGSSIEPYAGAGLQIAHASYDYPNFSAFDHDNTEAGLNLLGGIFFPIGDLSGFAEGKFELAGADQFVLSAGILFGG